VDLGRGGARGAQLGQVALGVHHPLVRHVSLISTSTLRSSADVLPKSRSRAFPSSLIDGDKDNSTPVLFPGIDMLNHRPTAKVTWSSDVHAEVASGDGAGDKGSLTIVLDEDVPARASLALSLSLSRLLSS